LFVTAQNAAVVMKVPANGSPVNLLAGSNLLNLPRGLAVDSDHNVYVAGDDTVLKITPGGTKTQIIDADGGDGPGGAMLGGAFGVAVGPSSCAGEIFVTGFASDNVFRIKPDLTANEILKGGKLDGPREIATDTNCNVYVTQQESATAIALTHSRTSPTVS